MAERPNSPRLTVLFRICAFGLPGRLIGMKQQPQGRPVKNRLARGHVTDLIVSSSASEVATRQLNALAEPLFARNIEVR